MTETATELGLWALPIAVFGGAIRVGTPFLFVSVGECLTEKAGRVNLGLEGTLVMGAMTGYAISYLTGSPWLGVLAAGSTGAVLGALHAVICNRPRVNSVAVRRWRVHGMITAANNVAVRARKRTNPCRSTRSYPSRPNRKPVL